MAAAANPKLIGAFVLAGIGLIVGAAVVFGSFSFFAVRVPFVMYFTGDMTGLQVGSPVVFQGVQVGEVTSITLHFDATANTLRIPVQAEIDTSSFVVDNRPPDQKEGENLPALVKKGLRAQLAAQSLVTGQLLVSLDFHPDTPANMVSTDSSELEVPTIPSEMEQLQNNVERLIQTIISANIPQLIVDLRNLVTEVNDKIAAIDTERYSREVTQLTNAYSDLARTLETRVEDLSASIEQTANQGTTALRSADTMFVGATGAIADAQAAIDSIQNAANRATQLLTTTDGVIAPGSPLYRELLGLIEEMTLTSQSIRNLANQLERDPTSVLFGKTEN